MTEIESSSDILNFFLSKATKIRTVVHLPVMTRGYCKLEITENRQNNMNN